MNNYEIVDEMVKNFIDDHHEDEFRYAKCVGFLQAKLTSALIHLDIRYPEAYHSFVNELRGLKIGRTE